jgi:glutaminyl-peptide cyclotransferase
MEFGPRIPESESHKQTQNYIIETLQAFKWETSLQEGKIGDIQLTNIIGKLGNQKPIILIGAHYDSRIYADRENDLKNRNNPVPGANDGASGVAILLEMARILYNKSNQGEFNYEIWLVFFDLEDNGGIMDYDWIMGSRYFIQNIDEKPQTVVILDMVGDKNLGIYQEKLSTKSLVNEIWQTADVLGYENYFLPEEKYQILDDHVPFLEAGIPAVDIIDIEYKDWHTVNDLLSNVSPDSLKIVGDTILHWLDGKLLQKE